MGIFPSEKSEPGEHKAGHEKRFMKIEPGWRVFLDTNVLLDATDEGRVLHELAFDIFRVLPATGVVLQLATQVLREYLVVATRPITKNGLGLDLEDAIANADAFSARATPVSESLASYEQMKAWAKEKRVVGMNLHDLQILSTATCAGADVFVTTNIDDFPPGLGTKVLALKEIEFPNQEQ